MSTLKHKKIIILTMVVVATLASIAGVVLLEISQNEDSKVINLDSKLDYQYLTTDTWFQKQGKVQVNRQYEGKSENFKLIVEDRLEYRGSPYIKKGTNYDDPYFYMQSIAVTEYIGEKDINDIKIMQIQEKSLRGKVTRWNEEPINCFNDHNLYITRHKSDPVSVNINEHSMTFTFDDGITEIVEAKLIDSKGYLDDVDAVFDKKVIMPINYTIKDMKKSKDLKSLLNKKVRTANFYTDYGKLAGCNMVLEEDDEAIEIVYERSNNRFLGRKWEESILPFGWDNINSEINLRKVINIAISIEKWMKDSLDMKYDDFSISLSAGAENPKIDEQNKDNVYRFKGNKIIECELELIYDAKGKFIIYTGEKQYVVYY